LLEEFFHLLADFGILQMFELLDLLFAVRELIAEVEFLLGCKLEVVLQPFQFTCVLAFEEAELVVEQLDVVFVRVHGRDLAVAQLLLEQTDFLELLGVLHGVFAFPEPQRLHFALQ